MTDKQEEEGENVESITYGFAVGKNAHTCTIYHATELTHARSPLIARLRAANVGRSAVTPMFNQIPLCTAQKQLDRLNN